MSELEEAMNALEAAEGTEETRVPLAEQEEAVVIPDGEPEQEAEEEEDYTQYTDPNSEHWQGEASGKGWKPLREWVAAGNSPKDHRSPREFVERGDLIKRVSSSRKELDQVKTSVEQRMESMEAMYKANMEEKLAALVNQRNEAVDLADRDGFDAAQKQIDDLQTEKPKPQQARATTNETVQQWEQQNPWIHDGNNQFSPNYQKAAFAQVEYNKALSQGASPDQALAHMTSRVSQSFPAVNANRESAPIQETQGKPVSRGKAKLTWDGLSQMEKNEYSKGEGTIYKDRDTFIDIVKRIRG